MTLLHVKMVFQRLFGWQDVVEPLTAGIIPHQVDSPYSNMIIYDLAGHHQYFSSHCACLEAISLESPATFLLLQDIRKDEETITKEVHYWSTMIDGVCHRCFQKPSVIVVGTHADLLAPQETIRKMAHLNLVSESAISHQKLIKVVSLNLTQIYEDKMNQFMNLLHATNKDVINMCPSISMMCHMMLAFVEEKLPPDLNAISLSDILLRLKDDPDQLIDPAISNVIPLLNTLSDKGFIVFMPSDDPHKSWVVLKKECILKEVNGALFADPSFMQYTKLASNIGIIPCAVLQKAFPHYNIEMITKFMVHFELYHEVDLSAVVRNVAPAGLLSPDLGSLFFFPALVYVDRPFSATVSNSSFRWSIIVNSPKKFLFYTTRFLHVLLRRLPFEFALPLTPTSPLDAPFDHGCDVWSRGIKWLSKTGVTTIVEMDEMLQSLSLAMSSPDRTDPKYLELAHSVLAVIKKACQEFCPHVEVLEIVSCPPEASSDHSDDAKVELSSLKKALLEGDKSIVDVTCRQQVVIEEWMKIEPCLPNLIGGETVDTCRCCY